MLSFFRGLVNRLRMLTSSIRFRLTMWFVAILAVVLAAFSGFVYVRQSHDLYLDALNDLDLSSRQWDAYLHFAAREFFESGQPPPSFDPRSGGPNLRTNQILALVDLNGKVIAKSGPITDNSLVQLASLGIQRQSGDGPFSYAVVNATATSQTTRTKYVFIISPIAIEQRRAGYLILGSPVDPSGELPRTLVTLVLGSLVMLAIASGGGYLLADRAMHPVKQITRMAREIGETDLSQRLRLESHDELGELASTFDEMLERLEAAFNRQRQFTADASHELRTPLTIVGLEASRALAIKRTSNEYERALRVIASENEYMTRLVNNLLTLSRMDAGQTVLKMQPLDLSELVLDSIERLAPLAAKNQVHLSTGELPELKIRGDPQFLAQMIVNLVENAIKYAGGEQKQVRVETGMGAGTAWLRVIDNGPGIPPEHIPRLFDRFYQVDKARTRDAGEGENAKGSGLGLAIVQWIVKAHGGSVHVESRLGEGSAFEVTLPLAE